jgi:2'-5' RNA ligase
VRERLAELLRELRERDWPVRWVGEAGIHVTLKFYGEVPDERADAIAESIGFAVDGVTPLAMALDGLGAFPAWERARVVWAGLQAPTALELLQDRIERGADALGFPPEGVTFRPHVTLGRVREGERLPAAALDALRARELAGEFVADEVVLFQSRLGGRTPDYLPVRTFPLAP